jgi:DNA-directed RNA polymerase specialized sigma24 family protein
VAGSCTVDRREERVEERKEQVEIVALYEELGSYQALAALLGCHDRTVKRYVELARWTVAAR